MPTIVAPQFEIKDESNPFEGDLFNREEFAKNLESFLKGAELPLVIAIDGQWGSGKSVFLKMWEHRLRQEKYKVVYFDAFENDYQDDAFLSIAGQILGELNNPDDIKHKKLMEKTVNVLKNVGGALAKAGIRYATAGLIDDKALESAKDSGVSSADKLIEELIKKQASKKAVIEEFKLALAATRVDDQPLIIIIDELDRCRPKFALEILERMKHFFSTQNVHFILGVNLEQLAAAIKHEHGETINASLYLEKFINFKTGLPITNRNSLEKYSALYFQQLVNRIYNKEYLPYTLVESFKHFGINCGLINLPFRTIERFVTNFQVLLNNKNLDHLVSSAIIEKKLNSGSNNLRDINTAVNYLIIGLILLKTIDQQSLNKLNLLDFEDFCKILNISENSYVQSRPFFTTWKLFLDRHSSTVKLVGNNNYSTQHAINQEQLEKLFILTPV